MNLKLLLLTENEPLGRQFIDEAKRLDCEMVVHSGKTFPKSALNQTEVDVILADVTNGIDLPWWEGADIPARRHVVFLHRDLSPDFMIQALTVGADALLPMTAFSSRLLEAHLQVAARRMEASQQKIFIPELNLALDSDGLRAEVGENLIRLTSSEFRVLWALATDTQRLVARSILQKRVLNRKFENRSLDVFVCTLRKKIRLLGLDIRAVRGVGYHLRGWQRN